MISFLTAHKTLPFLLIITLPLFELLVIRSPLNAIVMLYSHLRFYNLIYRRVQSNRRLSIFVFEERDFNNILFTISS